MFFEIKIHILNIILVLEDEQRNRTDRDGTLFLFLYIIELL